MKKKIFGFLATAIFLFTAGLAFAQDEEKKEVDTKLKISLKSYLEWSGTWGNNDEDFERITNGYPNSDEANEKNNNTFAVKRVYITFKKNFNEYFSGRVTTDITTDRSGTDSVANMLYLKYAYFQVKYDIADMVKLKLQGGKIGTPVVGLTDDLSDYRWIHQNYLDAAKVALDNQTIDYSADFGVKMDIGIMKWAKLSVAYTNGEGYKADETLDAKAITGLISVTPIKELYINGFGRYCITAKMNAFDDKFNWVAYWGAGVAYKSGLIKAGVNWINPIVKENGTETATGIGLAYPDYKRSYMLVDAWLHVELGEQIKAFPLIVTGRYVYGLKRRMWQSGTGDENFGAEKRTSLYAVGLGWKFNKNFRFLVGYEHQTYDVRKKEAVSYLAGQVGGAPTSGGETTGYYEFPAGTVSYVGTHNVHDRRQVYVKVEVNM